MPLLYVHEAIVLDPGPLQSHTVVFDFRNCGVDVRTANIQLGRTFAETLPAEPSPECVPSMSGTCIQGRPGK